LLDSCCDTIVKRDRSHRRVLLVRGFYRHPLEAIANGKVDEVYLGQIMVFAGQPEYGNGSGFLGELRRRDSLKKTEERTPENAYLLAGYDDRSAVAYALNILKGAGAGAKVTVLAFQDGGHGLAPVVGIDDSLPLFLPPVPFQRRPGIESTNFIEMVKKVVEKTAGVGDGREWNTRRSRHLVLYRLHEEIGLNHGCGDAKLGLGGNSPYFCWGGIPLFSPTRYDPFSLSDSTQHVSKGAGRSNGTVSVDFFSLVGEGVLALRLLCAILFLGSMAWPASFDKPLSTKTIDLGPSGVAPQARTKITCYWFARFMVKEVDLGEKGAARLAIVRGTKKEVPDCTRLRDKTEMAVNPDDWSGYFKGVKGNLVFFDADDGWNGGMGFAVYDAKTGKKIFDDVALGDLDISDAQATDSGITVRYTRIVDSGCIVPKELGACWDKITLRFALRSATAPDCKAAYEKTAQALAKGRCQAQNTDNAECLAKEIALARQQTGDANSIVAYPVEIVLGANPTIKPVTGDLQCWPSD
jgi:hypothetical protein